MKKFNLTKISAMLIVTLNATVVYAIERGSIYGGETVGDDVTVISSASPEPTFVGHAFGVYVNADSHAVAGDRLTIIVSGQAADGLRTNPSNSNAVGTITIGDGLSITTKGLSADAVNLNGYSKVFIGNNAVMRTEYTGDIPLLKEGAHGLRANYGSQIYVGNGLDLTTLGTKSYGIYANGSYGSLVDIGSDSKIKTQGTSSTAAQISGTDSKLTIGDRALFDTQGNSAHGIYANGRNGTIDIGNDFILNTAGDSAHGIYAYGRDGTVDIGNGLILNTTGEKSYGVYLYGTKSSALVYNSDVTLGQQSTIRTEGNGSHAAYMYSSDSSLTLGAKSNVTTLGDDAHGLYVSGLQSSATIVIGENGKIIAGDGATIKTSGSRSHGAFVNWNTGHIDFLGGADITASGPDSYAIYANAGQITSLTNGKYTITGDILADNNGLIDLSMTDRSIFTGTSQSTGSTDGIINLAISGSTSIWDMNGDSSLTGLRLADNATLKFNHADTSFKTLNVTENYTGTGGRIVMNTALGDDNSLTDKLVISGNTSGSTLVKVNNIGGNGGLTNLGIELIQVQGASDGEFVQDGRIIGGAFDYFLKRGDDTKGADVKNWYLTSVYTPTEPEPEPEPGEKPNPKPKPEPEPEPVRTTRPETASYAENLRAANTLFVTRLHDRNGHLPYIDPLTGEQQISALWMRQVGGHSRIRDTRNQFKTTSNSYVLQLGGHLIDEINDNGEWILGVMAGYANNHNSTDARLTGTSSKGRVNGYSLGVYGTWYQNKVDETGGYVDLWTLYNWFNNTVEGKGLSSEKYDSDGFTASIEGGYTFKLSDNQGVNYYVQPKAQAVWMGVKADNHRESSGIEVRGTGNDNVLTRLGIRAFFKDDSKTKDETNLQPYMEANWIHNTESFGVNMGNYQVTQDGTKNTFEAKLGLSGQINKKVSLWGDVTQQIGSRHYSDTAGMVGIKYQF